MASFWDGVTWQFEPPELTSPEVRQRLLGFPNSLTPILTGSRSDFRGFSGLGKSGDSWMYPYVPLWEIPI